MVDIHNWKGSKGLYYSCGKRKEYRKFLKLCLKISKFMIKASFKIDNIDFKIEIFASWVRV